MMHKYAPVIGLGILLVVQSCPWPPYTQVHSTFLPQYNKYIIYIYLQHQINESIHFYLHTIYVND